MDETVQEDGLELENLIEKNVIKFFSSKPKMPVFGEIIVFLFNLYYSISKQIFYLYHYKPNHIQSKYYQIQME